MGADPRFFERLGPLSAEHLAERAGGVVKGDAAAAVLDAAEPERAGVGELCFITKPPGGDGLRVDGAIVLVPSEDAAATVRGASAVVICASPKAAFAQAVSALLRVRRPDGTEALHPDAQIGSGAHIGAGALIAAGAAVGDGAEIGPGAVIGPGVVIGAGTRVGARAVVQCAEVGAACEIYAGAVIGEAGFGVAADAGALISIPHIGRVIIEDEVVIGANSTVDRGMIRDTVLRRACKIDNLCHIAHNCEIGAHTLMAAFSGVSGSVEVGKGAQFGGRAGVADHLRIGEGARLAAFAGVMKDVPDGEMWAGSPAQPIQKFLRETAWLRQASNKRRRKASRPADGKEASDE